MTLTESHLSSFGALLKHFRRRRQLTQQQLATAIGVHRNAVGRWERGDFLPETRGMVLELARHLRLDNLETRHLLEASLTAFPPFWSVYLPRNPFFTGREEILKTLHAQLGAKQTVALTQSSALYGLGGIGKTQIALEYAHRHALEYSAVFWIEAETAEQIFLSLLRICEVLQLPEQDHQDQQQVVAEVQRWLTTHGQWLLIWDNVEDLNLLNHFLPATCSGSILITTRCKTLGTLALGIDLPPMEQKEGVLFLLRRAKMIEPTATNEQVQQWARRKPLQYRAAVDLVRSLGCLPLALDQAGAYLEETQCGLSAYLELFRTQRAALLQQRGEGVCNHPASIFTTFTLAIASMRCHPEVWDLLRVCALLQPDSIPEELFRQGAEKLGARLAVVCHDVMKWNQTIAAACSYSLLSRQAEEQTLSLHRLVHAVLLDTMAEAEHTQWARRVIETLDTMFPDEDHISLQRHERLHKLRERLMPHVMLRLHEAGIAEESPALASLAYKAARYLHIRGQYAEAELLYQRALHIQEHAQELDHPDTARMLNALAITCWTRGKYAEAEPLYQRALHIRKHTLGPDHPDVARTLNGLAVLYWSQGKYAEAEPLYQNALQIWKQALGPDHPSTALALNNLAALYQDQGKYAKAEPLYQHALQIWEQTLGPDHADMALPLENLAELYVIQSKYAQAEVLYQRALHIREQTLESDHPDMAMSLNGLAFLYREQSKYAEAEALLQQARSIREKHLGQHHPETAQTLYDLAMVYQKQGNIGDALPLAECALKIQCQSLGDTHPKTIDTRTLYTQLLHEQRGSQEEVGKSSSFEDDHLLGFLTACCELHSRAWCRISDLWQAYERWVTEHQERFPLSRRAFAAEVKAHGCHLDRTSTARIWRGITLVNQKL